MKLLLKSSDAKDIMTKKSEAFMSDLVIPLNDNMRTKLENYASKRDQNLIDIAYNYLSRLIEEEEEDEDENDLYNHEFVAVMTERIQQLKEGKSVTMTLDELRATVK
jgi:hypothetical protein